MMEIAEEKQRRRKWELYGGKVWRGKGKWVFKNTKKDRATTGTQSTQGAVELVCEYLLKNARSFLASTVSRRVSLPVPVVTVSTVTVWLAADSFLPSSSSLSELLEEELSDATKGAFLATHTLHTHAMEEKSSTIYIIWNIFSCTLHKNNENLDGVLTFKALFGHTLYDHCHPEFCIIIQINLQ